MSFWSKAGVAVLILVAVAVTLGGAFLAWQKRSETKRIVENYGHGYLKMMKDYSKTSKRLIKR